MAQIAIDPVVATRSNNPNDTLYDSRAAQLLQNYLKDRLNPRGARKDTLYHLAIEMQQRFRSAASQGDGVTTREDLIMSAKYRLNDAKGQPVLNDVAQIVTSYDIILEPYNDTTTRRDAQQRAAQEVAEQIQTRLAVFLRK
jgi:LPS-assembly lipoprotein